MVPVTTNQTMLNDQSLVDFQDPRPRPLESHARPREAPSNHLPVVLHLQPGNFMDWGSQWSHHKLGTCTIEPFEASNSWAKHFEP